MLISIVYGVLSRVTIIWRYSNHAEETIHTHLYHLYGALWLIFFFPLGCAVCVWRTRAGKRPHCTATKLCQRNALEQIILCRGRRPPPRNIPLRATPGNHARQLTRL